MTSDAPPPPPIEPPLPPAQVYPAFAPLAEHAPKRVSVVLAIGLAVAVLLYTSASAVTRSYSQAFFAIPYFVGFVVGVLSLRRPFRNASFVLLAALLVAVVTLREGVVCLLFALPLLLPELYLGTACGWVVRRWLRSRRRRAAAVGGAVLLALGWQVLDGRLDDPTHHPVQTAESAIEIAAPPERVFAALTAPTIEVPARWPWFLRVGLPMPRSMFLAAPGPAGQLRLRFSQGTAFAHVTAWQPPRQVAFTVDRYEIEDLPFHITRLGRGPHYGLRAERVEDWLSLIDLRYELIPTGNGCTRLLRTTTWRRHLAPAYYFAWLQQTVIERGQKRLLELIKEQVERLPDDSQSHREDIHIVRR